MKIRILSILSLFILLASSCSYQRHVENKEAELEVLSNYIKTKGYPDSLASQSGKNYSVKQKEGYYYIEERLGKGNAITSSSTVSIRYALYSIDNDSVAVFNNYKDDNPKDINMSMSTSNSYPANIEGFIYGLYLMREGGEARFLIPSTLGYGKYSARVGDYSFGGYTTLIYKVRVTDVK